MAATQGMAQDFAVNPQVIEECLWTKPVERYDECIGLAADACMTDNDGGHTTVGTGACLFAEHEYWDRRLNAIYKVALKKAETMDGETAGYSDVPLKTMLRDMQRAWIAFRDAKCDFERAQWGGGTGGSPATANCLMYETAEQFFYLDVFTMQ